MVRARLDREHIPFDEVKLDLPENAEILASLKRILEREIIQTPIIRYAGEYRTIAGLHDIIDAYQKENA